MRACVSLPRMNASSRSGPLSRRNSASASTAGATGAVGREILKTLAELGGSAGNGRLQTELGWRDDTYWRVQSALVDEGHIVKGRGRGGSVALADASPSPNPLPSRESA